MAGDTWKRVRLGEFVTLQRGHDLPDERRRPGNVPILGSFGITGWHDEPRASGPGVTVGRSGASFGIVTYSARDYWPLNTALYVVDFHGNDPRFAYYLLKQFDFQGYNSGSAQPSLNRNFIHPIPIDIPPLPEQRAIAHILGTLDDKIELNRRMNETLEAMARALFKSWFVDFDPVRAKAEGRDPVCLSISLTYSPIVSWIRSWARSPRNGRLRQSVILQRWSAEVRRAQKNLHIGPRVRTAGQPQRIYRI
jgi:type I restriction enzyme, S subunit